MARILSEADVQKYADEKLGTSVLTHGKNRCNDQECLAMKILAQRENRDRNSWQSLLLSRYLRFLRGDEEEDDPAKKRRAIRTGYLLLAVDATAAAWMTTSTASAADATSLHVWHAEVILDPRRPEAYSNALIVSHGNDIVVLPFDPALRAAADAVPWPIVGAPRVAVTTVQQSSNPWLSLMWLHAALQSSVDGGADVDVVATLKQPWSETRGSALFEWHLCDELVPPLRPGSAADVRALLVAVDDERIERIRGMPPLRPCTPSI